MVFPTFFFNLSLNLMIWATISSRTCFYWLNGASPSSAIKNINKSDFSIDHLVISMDRFIFWVVGKGCLLWPVHSLGKSLVSFCPALFCTPRPNLPVALGISWLLTFAFQSPMMKRTSFCVCVCVLVLEGLVGLHRITQLQLLWH